MKLREAIELAGKTVAFSLMLAGCATAPRGETPPATALAATPPGYNQPIRTDALNREFFETRASEATQAVKASSDGSIDIWFGPAKPTEAADTNYIQTVNGRNFLAAVRLYGTGVEFFDQSWKPDDVVKVK